MKKKKNNRYIALDFEKLDTLPISVCSVGVAVIENDKIVDTFYSLICPPTKSENYYCVQTHGLHYYDVKNSPTFDVVWKKIDKIIGNSPILAHNFGTERGIINACNEYYGTNNDYDYICTLALSKKYLEKLPKKGLDLVCEALDYKLKRHHNALDDAIACAEVFLRIKKKFKLKDEDREQWFAKRK